MNARMGGHRVPIEPQAVDAPLTESAIFLTLTVRRDTTATRQVRDVFSDVDGLIKTVAFRGLGSDFACTVGIGAQVWDAIMGAPKPAELHPFRPLTGAAHSAPSTPGDLLFHLRADRQDLCYEFERLLMEQLGDAVQVADRTVGFRYFDIRDLLGFVDGTADPMGQALIESTIVGDEDPAATGGSYVVVQKYIHDLSGWDALTVEQQETIMGRRKSDNVELDDAPAGQKAHKTLTTIVDEEGIEHDILRDNMPFGSAAVGDAGTYFIGYSRELWVIERMLERMFIGDPPGLHDRLLDFSTALTGATFFAPSAAALAALGQDASNQTQEAAAPPAPSVPDPSLGIGGRRAG